MSSKKKKTYHSFSSEETKKLATEIASRISKKSSSKGAFVVALDGNLGAGKTTFVQGFLKGLGSKKGSPSPTFIIMRRKELRNGTFKNVFHIDAYRLKDPAQLAALDFEKIASDPKNILLIEWADRVKKILPKKIMRIVFTHGKKEYERIITLQ